MIHNPYIIRIPAVRVPTNAHKCIETNLYKQWPPTCFGHIEGGKIQRLDTLKA